MSKRRLPYLRILKHSLCKRCPRCGHGRLFARWYTLRERCDACDLAFEPSEGSTWAFMYVTTAAITGFIIAVMLITGAGGDWMWRLFVVPLALVSITGTLPIRKSFAITLEYVMDVWFERHETPPNESSREALRGSNAEHR